MATAAPSSEPAKRRTNTTGTYIFWENQIRKPELNSVLLITSPAYVIYQGCLAIEHLGIDRGLEVETVGVTPAAAELGAQTRTMVAAGLSPGNPFKHRGARRIARVPRDPPEVDN